MKSIRIDQFFSTGLINDPKNQFFFAT